MMRSVRRKSRARRASAASIGLDAADRRGVDLLARHALHEDGEERRLLHAAAGSEQAVVREQHRVLGRRGRRR